jgi:hypothetical protein
MANSLLQELIKYLGSAAIIMTAIAWLIKTLTTHSLRKDADAYKQQLARDTESFKSRLEMAAKEHEIRFGKLHEKRAQIIEQLYLLLDEAQRARRLIPIAHKLGEQGINKGLIKEISDSYRKLVKFFDQNKLYFSSNVAEQMQKIINEIGDVEDYALLQNEEKARDHLQTLEKALLTKSYDFRKAMKLIEQEFRTLLGSDKDINAKSSSHSPEASAHEPPNKRMQPTGNDDVS